MSLDSGEIDRLVALGAPVLCVDTCSILDVVRDITRETTKVADAKAGLSLLRAAETRTELVVLVAEQVCLELTDHVATVEQEANVALQKFMAQAARIDGVASVFGAKGAVVAGHLRGHVSRARAVLDRWTSVAQRVPHDADTTARAFLRVNGPRTPARRGKESMKDCVVVETYLEVARRLRFGGLRTPIVFASSNTKDYHGAGSSHLAADIATDFATTQIEYAPNFGAALHTLRI